MATLDMPALGLAKVPAALARVLPTGAELSCEWSLREDEVVAVVGCTPPPAKYFGLTPYLYRVYQGGNVRTSFSSLGDTLSTGIGGDLNGVGAGAPSYFTRLSTAAGTVQSPQGPDGQQGVLRGVSCFDSGFAMLVGGSRTTLNRAVEAAGLSGHVPGGAGAVNSYGLSRQMRGLFGLAAASSVYTQTVVVRHAMPADPTAWDAYAASPPYVVLRLTPRRRPLVPSPFPRATLIERETFDERPLAGAVTAVANRIASYFNGGGAAADDALNGAGSYLYGALSSQVRGQVLFDNGQLCIDTGWNCGGDNRDTTYIRSSSFLLPDENAATYVVGVNHAATGNAHYSNVAVYNTARNLGIVSVDDSEYVGTAVKWAAGSPEAEAAAGSLYVVALARSCPDGPEGSEDRGKAPHFFDGAESIGPVGETASGRSILPDGALCVEVPAEGFPSASSDQEVEVWERPYSSIATTVGPWWNRLALPALVQVRRVAVSTPELPELPEVEIPQEFQELDLSETF